VRSAGRLFAASILVSLIACTVGADVEGTIVREVNEPFPTLSGDGVEGSTVSSQSFAGKVLVVNAWATWCAPCRQEQPDLVRLADRFSNSGVAFLGINHRDDQAKAGDWIRNYHVPYPSIYDPAGRVALTLSYVGLPDTYVVDRTGTTRFIVNGPTDEAQLAGLIEDVLALPRTSATTPASPGPGAQTSASTPTATNSPAR
jgi:thiol-disulfide isomerase/thioredoxin